MTNNYPRLMMSWQVPGTGRGVVLGALFLPSKTNNGSLTSLSKSSLSVSNCFSMFSLLLLPEKALTPRLHPSPQTEAAAPHSKITSHCKVKSEFYGKTLAAGVDRKVTKYKNILLLLIALNPHHLPKTGLS